MVQLIGIFDILQKNMLNKNRTFSFALFENLNSGNILALERKNCSIILIFLDLSKLFILTIHTHHTPYAPHNLHTPHNHYILFKDCQTVLLIEQYTKLLMLFITLDVRYSSLGCLKFFQIVLSIGQYV